VAPDGALETVQVSATVPVKEFVGVTVISDVPLEPWAAVMLPPLARVKLAAVQLVQGGACQKSPQPARSVAAASNPIQRPIFIVAPSAQYSGYTHARRPTLF
jgi:hypothetical protein